MSVSRRGVLTGIGAGALSGLAFTTPAHASAPVPASEVKPRPLPRAPIGVSPERLATDEKYWARVARSYRVSNEVINLENGYFGAQPDVVLADYAKHINEIAERTSYYMRQEMGTDWARQVTRTAAVAGCKTSEICLTRGATEALQMLIGGYNKIGPGDVALYTDLDYDAMQEAMEWLTVRRGATVVKGEVPQPATRQAVLDFYEKLLKDNPKAKLLLLTHVSHKTGLRMPIAEITEMAEKRGADVIVDAAHSWGQIDFKVTDIKAPFIGLNYHKWMGTPLGVGAFYIREDRIKDIDPAYLPNDPALDTNIKVRVHTGTVNTANTLTISSALAFHEAVGAANKDARLRYLRDLWVRPVLNQPRIQILTPEDPSMYSALTAFRIKDKVERKDSDAITKWLLDTHNIFTVRRGGVAGGEVIRVTPALYNTPEESRRLAAALTELVKVF